MPIDNELPFNVPYQQPVVSRGILHPQSHMVDLGAIHAALYFSQTVVKIKGVGDKGTGFLIGPDLLLTCHHVLEGV